MTALVITVERRDGEAYATMERSGRLYTRRLDKLAQSRLFALTDYLEDCTPPQKHARVDLATHLVVIRRIVERDGYVTTAALAAAIGRKPRYACGLIMRLVRKGQAERLEGEFAKARYILTEDMPCRT